MFGESRSVVTEESVEEEEQREEEGRLLVWICRRGTNELCRDVFIWSRALLFSVCLCLRICDQGSRPVLSSQWICMTEAVKMITRHEWKHYACLTWCGCVCCGGGDGGVNRVVVTAEWEADVDREKNKREASHQAAHTADLGSANGW